MNTEQVQMRSALGDVFDKTFRSLHDRADVTWTRMTPVQHVHPVLEVTTNYTVQTARERDHDGRGGDTIFVTCLGTEGSIRIALPPEVADAIARQRDALTTKNRRAAARLRAAQDKAAGRLPGFMRGNGESKPKRKKKAKPKGEEVKDK